MNKFLYVRARVCVCVDVDVLSKLWIPIAWSNVRHSSGLNKVCMFVYLKSSKLSLMNVWMCLGRFSIELNMRKAIKMIRNEYWSKQRARDTTKTHKRTHNCQEIGIRQTNSMIKRYNEFEICVLFCVTMECKYLVVNTCCCCFFFWILIKSTWKRIGKNVKRMALSTIIYDHDDVCIVRNQ